MVGQVLHNRYRLEAELGRGGMGIVYRARDELLDRDVAIKILHDEAKSRLGPDGRTRLLQEAQATARLNHPNIINTYDFGEEAGQLFIVMELVKGRSLYECKPKTLLELLEIAIQITAALEHAHSQGLVHRDLKPENILITAEGIAKLTDFGLARPVSAEMKAEGALFGTVFYLAPEVALRKMVDGRADLYSLGVILYEMATGQLPFTGDEALAIISQHLYAPLTPPRALKPGLSPALDEIIQHLLEKRPEDRPASAGEVNRLLVILKHVGRLEAAEAGQKETLPSLDGLVRGRLIGREQELAEITALWRSAAVGEGHVLMICGEPGVGKTRLVRELMATVSVTGGRVLEGECYPEGGLPYSPFARVLAETLPPAPEAPPLPEYVLDHLLAITHPLDIPASASARGLALDLPEDQHQVLESFVAWIAALCQRQPVLLFIDDAHWADSATLSVLRRLARRARRLPLLIVVTYREGDLDEKNPLQAMTFDLNRERLATRLKLSRLSAEETQALLNTMLTPKGQVSEPVVRAIYRETEGNPFFIEEVTKALIEEGKLRFEAQTWNVLKGAEIEIPQSVRAIIGSRLARLPDSSQQVLKLAAIFGREFEYETLQAGSDLDEDALIEALERAEQAQIISELRRQKGLGPAFAFAHSLIASTLRESMGGLRRRRLHRRAAEVLEKIHPDDIQALAYHYEQAGEAEPACRYYSQLARRALAVHANQEAETHLRSALELCPPGLGQTAFQVDLGESLFRQGRYSQALDTWKRAISLYLQARELDAAARIYARAARATEEVGSSEEALALCLEGLAAIQNLSGAATLDPLPPGLETPGMAALLHETARAYRICHHSAEARPLFRQALALAKSLHLVEIEAEAYATLGVLEDEPPEAAQEALEQAIRLAEAAGLLSTACRAHANYGSFLMDQGDLNLSLEHYRRARELALQARNAIWEHSLLADVCELELDLGEFQAVENDLSELSTLLGDLPNLEQPVLLTQMVSARLHRCRGEFEDAARLALSCRDGSRRAKIPSLQARASRLLAEMAFESQRLEEAREHAREAGSIQGMVYPQETAEALFLHAAAAAYLGLEAEALSRFEAGRELLRQTSMQAGHEWELWAQAQLAVSSGRWEEAWPAFEALVQFFDQRRMRWRLAFSLLEWGQALLKQHPGGDAGRARPCLESAREIFSSLGMVYYTELTAKLAPPA